MKERGGGILEIMSMMMMIQVDFGSEQILDSRSMCKDRKTAIHSSLLHPF